jgi:pyruvate kinase
MPHTKIVVTVGPASSSPEMLERLVHAGARVFRLNFSHGDHAGHLAVLEAIRDLEARLGRPIAILQDLCGPKIRVGRMEGDGVRLEKGAALYLTNDDSILGTAARVGTSYEPLAKDVSSGDRILLDDGNLSLRVVRVEGGEVLCTVVDGGTLRSHKGMNLPGVQLSTPALTAKDKEDLAFGVRHGVDFVALSFVRRSSDVTETKNLIRELGGDALVIAKIEKPEAVADLDAILTVADGVMVARGDLGVELGTEEVPTIQKRIIAKANAAGKAVITATQMLESMIDNPRPTRAEASDVANAILDGTDAVMLSAETAVGRHVEEAVRTMARIAKFTEAHDTPTPPRKRSSHEGSEVTFSLARVAASVANELGCSSILAFTESGATARLVSSFRPRSPILAITHDEQVARRLCLWHGVLPRLAPFVDSTEALLEFTQGQILSEGHVKSGDRILELAGQGRSAITNMLRVYTMP